MAGKPKPVDLKAMRQLARIGATDVQIGHCLGLSVDTLSRRFRAEIDTARAEGGVWALQRCHERAARGSWPAIECLLTHLCGWGKAHADQVSQVINVIQQNTAGPQLLDAATIKARMIQAHEYATKFLAEHNGEHHGQERLPG
jgi:hypothetical protein